MTEYIDNNNFFPGILRKNIDINDPENTEEHLSIYKMNSMGYRCPEFDKIDFKESIFLFGCSCAFGVKLKTEETISYNLEQILGRPVINMALPGSSIQFNYYNQFKLALQEENPYGVINLWTSINRLPFFKNPEAVVHLGPWVDDKNSDRQDLILTRAWLNNRFHPIYTDKLSVKNARFLWRNTRHVEGTVFIDSSKNLNIQYFTPLDYSDNNGHPGPKSALDIATQFATQIKALDKY